MQGNAEVRPLTVIVKCMTGDKTAIMERELGWMRASVPCGGQCFTVLGAGILPAGYQCTWGNRDEMEKE